VTSVYEKIVNQLNILGECRQNYKEEIKLVAQAGYYAAAATDCPTTDADFHNYRVVFASNNFMATEAVVSTPAKREIVEKILNGADFEFLITVRLITSHKIWTDYSTV
jgi:hypothetical protein